MPSNLIHSADWEALIPFYAAQTLSPREAAAFEAHLARCEICRRELHEWRLIASAVRADSASHLRNLPPLSPALQQMMRGADADTVTTPVRYASRRVALSRRAMPFTFAAALMLLVVGAFIGYMTFRAGDDGLETASDLLTSKTPTVESTQQNMSPSSTPVAATPTNFITNTPIVPTRTVRPSATPTLTITPPSLTTASSVQVTQAVAVVMGTVNLRSGPGTAYEVVGMANAGERFPIVAAVGGGTDRWLLIARPAGSAWLYASIVTIDPLDAVIAPAATVPAPILLASAVPETATPTLTLPATTPTVSGTILIRGGNWMHAATITEHVCENGEAFEDVGTTQTASLIIASIDDNTAAMTYAATGFSFTLYRTSATTFGGTYPTTAGSVTVSLTFTSPITYTGQETIRETEGCIIRSNWYGSAAP